jgi:hypothetical protein
MSKLFWLPDRYSKLILSGSIVLRHQNTELRIETTPEAASAAHVHGQIIWTCLRFRETMFGVEPEKTSWLPGRDSELVLQDLFDWSKTASMAVRNVDLIAPQTHAPPLLGARLSCAWRHLPAALVRLGFVNLAVISKGQNGLM